MYHTSFLDALVNAIEGELELQERLQEAWMILEETVAVESEGMTVGSNRSESVERAISAMREVLDRYRMQHPLSDG